MSLFIVFVIVLFLVMLIIVSGLFGLGKMVVLKIFEDFDYYCLDNLLINLLLDFVCSLFGDSGIEGLCWLVVGIDVCVQSDLIQFLYWCEDVKVVGFDVQLLFFDVIDEILFKCYVDIWCCYLLSQFGLLLFEVIVCECELIVLLCCVVDVVIDIIDFNVYQLCCKVVIGFVFNYGSKLFLLFELFVYKCGVLVEVDFVFDVCVLFNLYWNMELCLLLGCDWGVCEYLDEQLDVKCYVVQLVDFFDIWLLCLGNDICSYVIVVFGCIGGKYCLVYLVEWMVWYVWDQGWLDVVMFYCELD